MMSAEKNETIIVNALNVAAEQYDRDAQGRPMTKTAQVAKCGNSVCPPLSCALVEANAPSLRKQLELPAAQAA